MAKIADHYPETLRDIYDKIEETLADHQAASTSVDIPLYVTEWLRKHWSGRLLIPSWWGMVKRGENSDTVLPGVTIQTDIVSSVRGRELRAAVWQILVEHWACRRNICGVATVIAHRVEVEWAQKPVYVPKAKEVDRAIRDAQVWNDFGGLNTIDRVIQKHGLSQSVIYDIHRRLQKDKDAREQPELPLFN